MMKYFFSLMLGVKLRIEENCLAQRHTRLYSYDQINRTCRLAIYVSPLVVPVDEGEVWEVPAAEGERGP